MNAETKLTLENDIRELRKMAAQILTHNSSSKAFFLRIAGALESYAELLGYETVGPGRTPNAKLPPIGAGPRKKMLIEVEVTEDFEKRLDNQWMVEREIHSDRWKWCWKAEP